MAGQRGTSDVPPEPLVEPAPGAEPAPAAPPAPAAQGVGAAIVAAKDAQAAAAPVDREHDPMVGQVLGGRYRVLERLAEGGMGTVYRAEHIGLRKEVALKLVNEGAGARSDHALRFLREAMLTSRIEHPNVISATDYGTFDDGTAYLAMTLVTGPTLASVMARERPMAWARAAEIGAQIADAVAAAGAQGIVHRDLKPENLHLQPLPDGTEVVKVLDFGIAKYARDSLAPPAAKSVQQATRVGMVVGTPGYMAPEQAVGMRADHRADLYAIGVILWECVVGRKLWEADDMQRLLAAQLNRKPASVRTESGDETMPESFERLVAALLATRPEDRPTTAVQVRDTLRGILLTARGAGGIPERPAPTVLKVHAPRVGAAGAGATFRMRALAALAPRPTSAADARGHGVPTLHIEGAGPSTSELSIETDQPGVAPAAPPLAAPPPAGAPPPMVTEPGPTTTDAEWASAPPSVEQVAVAPKPSVEQPVSAEFALPPEAPPPALARVSSTKTDATARARRRWAVASLLAVAALAVALWPSDPTPRPRAPALVAVAPKAPSAAATPPARAPSVTFTPAQATAPAVQTPAAVSTTTLAVPSAQPATAVKGASSSSAAQESGTDAPAPSSAARPRPKTPVAQTAADDVAFAGLNAEALRALARRAFSAGDFQRAADAYRAAIAKSPDHAGAQAGLGASRLALGDSQGAVAAYQRAIALAPTTSGFHAALGRAYLVGGQRARAIAAYRQAVALDPNNQTAFAALAQLAP